MNVIQNMINLVISFKSLKAMKIFLLISVFLFTTQSFISLPREPEVQEQLLHCTVNIITKVKTSSGALSDSGGTGFFYQFETEKGDIPVIITNRHVIKNVVDGKMIFTSRAKDGSPNYGDHLEISLTDNAFMWIEHPDPNVDLCMAMFQPVVNAIQKRTGKLIYYKVLEEKLSPSKEDWETIYPNTDVVMTGYPNGFSDRINNLPTSRRGVVSSLPRLGFEGRNEFLIDVPVSGGSSGSPVLIYQNNGNATRILFGGIVYAGPTEKIVTSGKVIRNGSITSEMVVTSADVPLDFAYVIKSDEILGFKTFIDDLISQER